MAKGKKKDRILNDSNSNFDETSNQYSDKITIDSNSETPQADSSSVEYNPTEYEYNITINPIEDAPELYEEPYKVLACEIDDWSTIILHETMVPISIQYHPVTGRLNVLVIQDYVSWAHMNKEEFEKETKERKKKDMELNLAVASELEAEKMEPAEKESSKEKAEEENTKKEGTEILDNKPLKTEDNEVT